MPDVFTVFLTKDDDDDDVIHVSVNIKNNAEKDTTFFFLKVWAAM